MHCQPLRWDRSASKKTKTEPAVLSLGMNAPWCMKIIIIWMAKSKRHMRSTQKISSWRRSMLAISGILRRMFPMNYRLKNSYQLGVGCFCDACSLNFIFSVDIRDISFPSVSMFSCNRKGICQHRFWVTLGKSGILQTAFQMWQKSKIRSKIFQGAQSQLNKIHLYVMHVWN